jgi:hypothetical protein
MARSADRTLVLLRHAKIGPARVTAARRPGGRAGRGIPRQARGGGGTPRRRRRPGLGTAQAAAVRAERLGARCRAPSGRRDGQRSHGVPGRGAVGRDRGRSRTGRCRLADRPRPRRRRRVAGRAAQDAGGEPRRTGCPPDPRPARRAGRGARGRPGSCWISTWRCRTRPSSWCRAGTSSTPAPRRPARPSCWPARSGVITPASWAGGGRGRTSSRRPRI